MSDQDLSTPKIKQEDTISPRKKKKWPWVILIIVLVILYTQIGFYSIQPIGAIPEGITLLIWRNSGEPFFNSPDAVCLDVQGYVSLLCRGLAIGEAPADRIIFRLPYQNWAYLRSTGGMELEQ